MIREFDRRVTRYLGETNCLFFFLHATCSILIYVDLFSCGGKWRSRWCHDDGDLLIGPTPGERHWKVAAKWAAISRWTEPQPLRGERKRNNRMEIHTVIIIHGRRKCRRFIDCWGKPNGTDTAVKTKKGLRHLETYATALKCIDTKTWNYHLINRWIQLNLKHPENIKMAERVGNELSNATRMQMKSGPSWFSVAGTHVILPAPTVIVTVEMLLQMFRLALPTAVGKAVGRELLMFVYSHVIGKWQLIDCHWVWSWSW